MSIFGNSACTEAPQPFEEETATSIIRRFGWLKHGYPAMPEEAQCACCGGATHDMSKTRLLAPRRQQDIFEERAKGHFVAGLVASADAAAVSSRSVSRARSRSLTAPAENISFARGHSQSTRDAINPPPPKDLATLRAHSARRARQQTGGPSYLTVIVHKGGMLSLDVGEVGSVLVRCGKYEGQTSLDKRRQNKLLRWEERFCLPVDLSSNDILEVFVLKGNAKNERGGHAVGAMALTNDDLHSELRGFREQVPVRSVRDMHDDKGPAKGYIEMTWQISDSPSGPSSGGGGGGRQRRDEPRSSAAPSSTNSRRGSDASESGVGLGGRRGSAPDSEKLKRAAQESLQQMDDDENPTLPLPVALKLRVKKSLLLGQASLDMQRHQGQLYATLHLQDGSCSEAGTLYRAGGGTHTSLATRISSTQYEDTAALDGDCTGSITHDISNKFVSLLCCFDSSADLKGTAASQANNAATIQSGEGASASVDAEPERPLALNVVGSVVLDVQQLLQQGKGTATLTIGDKDGYVGEVEVEWAAVEVDEEFRLHRMTAEERAIEREQLREENRRKRREADEDTRDAADDVAEGSDGDEEAEEEEDLLAVPNVQAPLALSLTVIRGVDLVRPNGVPVFNPVVSIAVGAMEAQTHPFTEERYEQNEFTSSDEEGDTINSNTEGTTNKQRPFIPMASRRPLMFSAADIAVRYGCSEQGLVQLNPSLQPAAEVEVAASGREGRGTSTTSSAASPATVSSSGIVPADQAIILPPRQKAETVNAFCQRTGIAPLDIARLNPTLVNASDVIRPQLRLVVPAGPSSPNTYHSTSATSTGSSVSPSPISATSPTAQSPADRQAAKEERRRSRRRIIPSDILWNQEMKFLDIVNEDGSLPESIEVFVHESDENDPTAERRCVGYGEAPLSTTITGATVVKIYPTDEAIAIFGPQRRLGTTGTDGHDEDDSSSPQQLQSIGQVIVKFAWEQGTETARTDDADAMLEDRLHREMEDSDGDETGDGVVGSEAPTEGSNANSRLPTPRNTEGTADGRLKDTDALPTPPHTSNHGGSAPSYHADGRHGTEPQVGHREVGHEALHPQRSPRDGQQNYDSANGGRKTQEEDGRANHGGWSSLRGNEEASKHSSQQSTPRNQANGGGHGSQDSQRFPPQQSPYSSSGQRNPNASAGEAHSTRTERQADLGPLLDSNGVPLQSSTPRGQATGSKGPTPTGTPMGAAKRARIQQLLLAKCLVGGIEEEAPHQHKGGGVGDAPANANSNGQKGGSSSPEGTPRHSEATPRKQGGYSVNANGSVPPSGADVHVGTNNWRHYGDGLRRPDTQPNDQDNSQGAGVRPPTTMDGSRHGQEAPHYTRAGYPNTHGTDDSAPTTLDGSPDRSSRYGQGTAHYPRAGYPNTHGIDDAAPGGGATEDSRSISPPRRVIKVGPRSQSTRMNDPSDTAVTEAHQMDASHVTGASTATGPASNSYGEGRPTNRRSPGRRGSVDYYKPYTGASSKASSRGGSPSSRRQSPTPISSRKSITKAADSYANSAAASANGSRATTPRGTAHSTADDYPRAGSGGYNVSAPLLTPRGRARLGEGSASTTSTPGHTARGIRGNNGPIASSYSFNEYAHPHDPHAYDAYPFARNGSNGGDQYRTRSENRARYQSNPNSAMASIASSPFKQPQGSESKVRFGMPSKMAGEVGEQPTDSDYAAKGEPSNRADGGRTPSRYGERHHVNLPYTPRPRSASPRATLGERPWYPPGKPTDDSKYPLHLQRQAIKEQAHIEELEALLRAEEAEDRRRIAAALYRQPSGQRSRSASKQHTSDY